MAQYSRINSYEYERLGLPGEIRSIQPNDIEKEETYSIYHEWNSFSGGHKSDDMGTALMIC